MADKVDQATATMIKNLEQKTGRSLADWVSVARKADLARHGEIVKFLKSEHGFTHGYANLVALETTSSITQPAENQDSIVNAQYSGEKANLRPIYDRLLKRISAFGSDVEVAPKKTYVSLRRSKQFAIIQPGTKTRLDVGINLKGAAASGRLEASGSFNSMVSHRVRLESPDQVDDELISWLRQAYDGS